MAETFNASSKIYLSINGNGKLAKKATADTPGAVKSVYNAGTPQEMTVWQTEFAAIKGHITGMYYNSHEKYGESLNIVIDNEYCLQLKVGNRYYYSFVKASPNIDFRFPVRFNPWKKEVDGKAKMALYLTQHDAAESLQWAFTKDNPNGMPQMREITYQGKQVWDDTELRKFCKDFITNTILPKLVAAGGQNVAGDPQPAPPVHNHPPAQTPPPQSPYEPDPADDLPF